MEICTWDSQKGKQKVKTRNDVAVLDEQFDLSKNKTIWFRIHKTK